MLLQIETAEPLVLPTITAVTVPLTATFFVVAQLDTSAIFPEGVPLAEFVIRTKIVVLATVPPLWVKVKEPANPDPEEVETSKPVGAVTVIFDIKPLPDAEKLCSAEAVPKHEVKPVKLAGETLIIALIGGP